MLLMFLTGEGFGSWKLLKGELFMVLAKECVKVKGKGCLVGQIKIVH